MDIAVEFEGKALVVLNQLCVMQMFGMHDLVAQFVAKITNPTGAGVH